MSNLSPTSLLPGYSFNGTSISFAVTDLFNVSAAEAHAASGDWRDVTQGLMMKVYEYINTLLFSDVKNAKIELTEDYTYDHEVLGTVLHRTVSLQFAVQYEDASIEGN